MTLPESQVRLKPGRYPNANPIFNEPDEAGTHVAVETDEVPTQNGENHSVPAETPEPERDLKRPYTIWSPRQFLAFVPDPSSNLIGDCLLQKGEWTSFIGIGGLGKTRLTLWMCICQILGRPWCGLDTGGTPQLCLILSTESGLRRWKKDLEKMFASLSEAERDKVNT